jgi:N-acetylglutamate synthase-like GNAT family acetyltransferase
MKDIVDEMNKSKKEQEELEGFSIREQLIPGDLGYLAYLHAKIYHAECGYDLEFEGYVCKTFSEFTKRYWPERDRFFIAEKDGIIIGSIAILGHSDEEAQLRWFIIAPEYRGMGLGQKLFRMAMEFCHEKGFKKIWLLTTSDQEKATSMYTKEGFELVSEESLSVWGRNLVEKRFEIHSK